MNRLLLADLKRMWRQGLAVSILLGCGIALFVMTNSSMVSLQKARREYYSEYRFGNVFASLLRAPNDLANRVAEVEGVQRVQRRIVRNVLLDIPTMAEPASCLLVSIDTSDPFPMNAIHLTRGRFPVGEDRSETIVSELFAEAHGLRPGDSLDCIMGGRKQRLRIVGIGLSPAFVYVAQPGLMITDNRRYGVVWMPRRQMEAAFNMEGAFNNLSIALQPRANTAAVIASIDRLTMTTSWPVRLKSLELNRPIHRCSMPAHVPKRKLVSRSRPQSTPSPLLRWIEQRRPQTLPNAILTGLIN